MRPESVSLPETTFVARVLTHERSVWKDHVCPCCSSLMLLTAQMFAENVNWKTAT